MCSFYLCCNGVYFNYLVLNKLIFCGELNFSYERVNLILKNL